MESFLSRSDGGLPTLWILHEFRDRSDVLHIELHLSASLKILGFSLDLLTILTHFLARAYLAVECCICVSHLPAGVYDVPDWSAYLPYAS